MENKYREALYILNIIGFLWLLLSSLFARIFMPRFFNYGGFYLFLTTWAIEFIIDRRWHFTFHREQIFFALLVLFFLWGFLYLPFDGDVYFKRLTERRYPLFAFGVVGFFGLNKLYTKRLIFNAMAILSTCTVIFIVANVGLINLITSPDRTQLFAAFSTTHINAHMGFDLYLIFTLIGLWWLNFRTEGIKLWQRISYAFSALLIILTLSISDGRTGMAIAALFICLLIFHTLWNFNRWIALSASLLFLAAGGFAISQNDRMAYDYISQEPRIAYWHSAFDLISERPILGYGMSNAQEEFDKVNLKYMPEYQRVFFTVEQPGTKDCHNQFIQTTLEFGIVGFILLLGIYLLPCLLVRREWRFLTCCIVGASLLQSLFDMFITGQFNIIFSLLLLTSMLMKNQNNYSEKPLHYSK